MSNENKPLTAEEAAKNFANNDLQGYPLNYGSAFSRKIDAFMKGVKWEREQTAALREELERSKERIEYYREAVKLLKESGSAIASLKRSMLVHPDHTTGSEFDDMTTMAQDVEDDINAFLSGLSSGETKPASPWISVEDQLPEIGQTVAFVIESRDDAYHGMVCGGRYQGFRHHYHEFTTPGIAWAGSRWLPLPAYERSTHHPAPDKEHEKE